MQPLIEHATPFFSRQSTIREIRNICKQDSIVIMCGAGVTIDKSGLTWKRMVSALLRPHVPDDVARERFVALQDPIFAASAAHELYVSAQDDLNRKAKTAARERMVDALKVALYAPGTWKQGELANNIAKFAYTWASSRHLPRMGKRRVCIATTNYDDYVMRALTETYRKLVANRKDLRKSAKDIPTPKILFPTDRDPLIKSHTKRPKWRMGNRYPNKHRIGCIHLHGRIPSSLAGARPSGFRFPVISEADYYKTAESSGGTMYELFARSSVIIVGASLVDPPLVRALEATVGKAKEFPRWCLFPVTGASGTSEEANDDGGEYQRLVTSRMSALKVKPIFVDHYMQVAQFFNELSACSTLNNPLDYATYKSSVDYYSRLDSWWRDWSGPAREETGVSKRQAKDHEFLRTDVLPAIRDAVEALHDETLKIEVWLRWDPRASRKLKLWASSVGTWSDDAAMRTSNIEDANKFLISECFTSGKPVLHDGRKGDPTARWGVYLATPIWGGSSDESAALKFVNGVVVVASMSDRRTSALNPDRSRSAVATCLQEMRKAGKRVARAAKEVQT